MADSLTSKTESLADRFNAKFSQAHSQSRPLIISWELAVEIRDALSGDSPAPDTGLAGQIEAARARIAEWPADVRAAMGLPDETSAPVWKRMRNQVPSNGTWIWWDYGKGPMLQRAQDFASEDDGYWIEATPPLRSPEEPAPCPECVAVRKLGLLACQKHLPEKAPRLPRA